MEPSAVRVESSRVATIRIKELTPISLRQVRGVCAQYLDPDQGSILRLVDPFMQTLIDPKLGVKVDPKLVAGALRDLRLSDGQYVFDNS